MGLILNNEQTNDGKILYLTDQSTWNDGDLPAYTTIDSAILSISYKTPDYSIVEVDIDVTSVFTNAASVDDLVFRITMEDLGGNANDPLPDGLYFIQYKVSNNGGTTYPWSFDDYLKLLLDALIHGIVYEKLSTIAYKYMCANNYYTKPIDDIILLNALYESMLASAYVSKQEEILNLLDVLQRQTT